MSYNTYHLLSSRLERIMWQSGKLSCTKKQRGIESIRETVRILCENERGIYNTIDLPLIIEEWHWLQTRQIIFPESETLLKRLSKTSAKIKRPDLLFKSQTESFILAFPKSFKIDGFSVSGVMVHLCDWQDRQQLINDYFAWLKLPAPESSVKDYGFGINLSYQMFHDHKEMYYRATIPIELVNKLINAKDGDEYVQILGNYKHHGVALTSENASYQQKIVKIILSLILYKKTVPESLIPGYPTVKKPKMEGYKLKESDYITLSIPTGHRDSPTEHYRSWSFRQLFADRFYQGEYENWERGSRIVFVRDTYVNLKEIDPKTLKG